MSFKKNTKMRLHVKGHLARFSHEVSSEYVRIMDSLQADPRTLRPVLILRAMEQRSDPDWSFMGSILMRPRPSTMGIYYVST